VGGRSATAIGRRHTQRLDSERRSSSGVEEPPEAPRSRDEGEQVAVRRAKLERLRAHGQAFPNDFRRNAECGALVERFGALDGATVEAQSESYALAGRVLAVRSFGKTLFFALGDGTGRMQLYVRSDEVSPEVFETLPASMRATSSAQPGAVPHADGGADAAVREPSGCS
jgi:lysyl-tRNA synthetase class II